MYAVVGQEDLEARTGEGETTRKKRKERMGVINRIELSNELLESRT